MEHRHESSLRYCAIIALINTGEHTVINDLIAFADPIRMRELIASNKDLAARVEKLERGHDRTSSVIEIVVEDLDRLGEEIKKMKALPPARKRRIGFRIGNDDDED